jgi:hypothetical protein
LAFKKFRGSVGSIVNRGSGLQEQVPIWQNTQKKAPKTRVKTEVSNTNPAVNFAGPETSLANLLK